MDGLTRPNAPGCAIFPSCWSECPSRPHTGQRFLVRAGHERAELIDALGRALISMCDQNRLSSVHVNFCAEDEAAILSKLGFMERLGYQYHWRNADYTTFDDYLAHLKSKRRYAVRHERAALAGQKIAIRVLPATIYPMICCPRCTRCTKPLSTSSTGDANT